MSGIDRNRVVGKEEDELDELTCGICREIFDDPVVTQCCRQTYCTLCMNQWLVDNNTCPNDRQRLSITDLIQPPRFVINLLNKLRIKCPNHTIGCEVIETIEKMKDHELNCEKNCSSCKDIKGTLQSKLKKAETDLEALNKKFEDFKLAMQQEINEEQVIIDARSVINNYVIEISDLDTRDMQSLIANCQNAINCSTDLFDLAKYIRDKMNAKTGFWTVIADTSSKLNCAATNDKYARIRFGHLITIYAYQSVD